MTELQRRRLGLRPRPVLGVLLVVTAALYLYVGRGLVPYYDDWTFITLRRAWDAGALLDPHNGHLSLIPVLVQKIVLEALGIDAYWLLRTFTVATHLAIGVLVFRFIERRVGGWAGVLGAALILGLGAGSIDVLWAFQLGFLISVAGGVLALLALGSEHRRAAPVTAVALTAAVASSGIGVIFLAGGIVTAALDRRRDRIIAVAVPTLLYLLWFVLYGRGEGQAQSSNLPVLVDYAAEMAAAACGGLSGLGPEFGRALAILGVGAIAVRIGRGHRLTPVAAGLLVSPVVLWGLTGLSRAQFGDPGAARYIYPGAVMIVLIAATLLTDVKPTRQGLLAAGALVILALGAGIPELRDQGRSLRSTGDTLRAQLAALALLEPQPPASFQPAPQVAPQISAAGYRAAAADYGGVVADPVATLEGAYSSDRAKADQTLIQGGSVVTTQIASRPSPPVGQLDVIDGTARRESNGCLLSRSGAAIAVVVAPGDSIVITPRAPATVDFARYGDNLGDGGARPLPAAPVLLRAATDASPRPWRVRVSGAPAEICGAA